MHFGPCPADYIIVNDLGAVDSPAKSLTFWGFSGKPLDFPKQLKSKDPTQ